MEVEVEHPHVHHHRIGEHWLDKVLPVAAILISAISIWIAYHHGQVMQELVNQNERLVQANSLPHMTHRIRTLNRSNGLGEIQFELTNSGIGPAEVRTAELVVEGRPVRNVDELLDHYGIPGGELSTAEIGNSMIRPGETAVYFKLNANPKIAASVDRMIQDAQQDRIRVRLCYCSVFDECWTISGAARRPARVAQCVAPKVAYE